MELWTIGRVLEWSADYLRRKGFTDSPRLDAQLMLARALGLDRVQLYLNYDRPLNSDELAAFKTLLKRRLDGEPVAYLLGRRSFWTLELAVGPGVLIPRPETETLVEAALDRLAESASVSLLELGVGSGAISLALASERPALAVVATDVSAEALAVAESNAETLGLAGRIEFLEGDLFESVPGRKFDMIVMNPPYVAEAEYRELDRQIVEFEPAIALLAGADGLEVIRRLVAEAPEHLRPGGWLLFEIGADQGPSAAALMEAGPFGEIGILPDLAGRDRVAAARLEQGRGETAGERNEC